MVVALTVPRGAKGSGRKNVDGSSMTLEQEDAAEAAEAAAESAVDAAPAEG
jgi:hypothetical protein